MSFKVASSRVFITAVVAIVSGIVQLSLAKLLGPGEFGIFAFIISLVGLGTSVSILFGLPEPAIRLFALASDAVRRYQLNAWILRISLVASVITSAILLIGAGILSPIFEWSLVLAVVCMPFVTRVRANAGIISALGRADIAALSTQVAPTAAMLIVLFLVWSELTARLAAVLVVGWLLGQVAAFLFSRYMRRRLLPRSEGCEADVPRDVRAHWKMRSWPIVLGKTLALFMNNIDLVLLGLLVADLAVVGNYGIAHRIYALSLIGLQSAQFSYGPRLARAIEVREVTVVRRVLRSQRLFGIVTAIACSLGAIFVLPYAIDFIAPKFQQAILPSQLMVLSTLFAAVSGPLGIMFEAMNKERLIMVLSIVLLAVTVVLCLILIPLFGIIGVALAVVAVQIIRTAVLLILEQRFKKLLFAEDQP